jgi:hypothetical protein
VTKLASREIAEVDPYKFMAVIGKRVIHPGGKASTESLLRRASITASRRVLDVGFGFATAALEVAREAVPMFVDRRCAAADAKAHMGKMAWLMPRMARAVPYLGYIVVAGTKPR